MERISALNTNQLAKELQSYEKYQGKTQKEIKRKLAVQIIYEWNYKN